MPPLIIFAAVAAVGQAATSALGAVLGASSEQGPKVVDTMVSSSAYGNDIQRCRGTVRLPGEVIWTSGIDEWEFKLVSGKFGANSQYIYLYSASLIVSFAAGPATKFLTVWADGRRLYSAKITGSSVTGTPLVVGATAIGAMIVQVKAAGLTLKAGTTIQFAPPGSYYSPDSYDDHGILRAGSILHLPAGSEWIPIPEYSVQSDVTLTGGTAYIDIWPPLVSPLLGNEVLIVPGLNAEEINMKYWSVDGSYGHYNHGGPTFQIDPATGQTSSGYRTGVVDNAMRFYLGTDTQLADPLLVEYLGTDNAPAYRGRVYVMIPNIFLQYFGNHVPQISAEIAFDTVTPDVLPVDVGDVIAWLCAQCDDLAGRFDTIAITGYIQIGGVQLGQQQLMESIMLLCRTYLFDLTETNGKITFSPRERASQALLQEWELGALETTNKTEPRLVESAENENAIPERVSLRYYDITKGYQKAVQYAKRISQVYSTDVFGPAEMLMVTRSRNEITVDLPVSNTATTMKQQAEKILLDFWVSRLTYQFKTLWRNLLLDPNDIIQINYHTRTIEMRLTSSDRGAGWALAFDGVDHDSGIYQSVAISDGGVGTGGGGGGEQSSQGSDLFILDLPLLADGDLSLIPGFYFAVIQTQPGTWAGAAAMESTDGGLTYAGIGNGSAVVTYGTAVNALGVPSGYPGVTVVFDDVNTLTVQIVALGASIAGVSDADIVADKNTAALIKGNGDIELIQWGTAVNNGDGTYTLSHLMRGVRGTEWAEGGHGIGDKFVYLDGKQFHRNEDISLIAGIRDFKAVTTGEPSTGGNPFTFTFTNQDLRPYSPVLMQSSADATGNISMAWHKRTRAGARWTDLSGNVPLNEAFEAYEIDIMDGATVKRTLQVSGTPFAVYPTTMQIADFGAVRGLTLHSVEVNVYQMSAQVGRGHRLNALVPDSLTVPVPPPPPPGGGGGNSNGIGDYVNGSGSTGPTTPPGATEPQIVQWNNPDPYVGWFDPNGMHMVFLQPTQPGSTIVVFTLHGTRTDADPVAHTVSDNKDQVYQRVSTDDWQSHIHPHIHIQAYETIDVVMNNVGGVTDIVVGASDWANDAFHANIYTRAVEIANITQYVTDSNWGTADHATSVPLTPSGLGIYFARYILFGSQMQPSADLNDPWKFDGYTVINGQLRSDTVVPTGGTGIYPGNIAYGLAFIDTNSGTQQLSWGTFVVLGGVTAIDSVYVANWIEWFVRSVVFFQ